MILEKSELSASQKAVLEELMGRALKDEERISLRTIATQSSPPSQRQAAVEKLREFLENRAHARADVNDAELDAAILEAMRSVRPGYTEIR